MSKKSPRALRALLTGAVALSVVAALGVGTASADDTAPTDGASSSPSAPASEAPPTGTPSTDPSATPTDPSTSPSEEPSGSPSTAPTTEVPDTSGRAAVKPPPDRYVPQNQVFFNYPYSKSVTWREANRTQVYRTINATTKGAEIRIAMFSVNDDATVNALLAAVKRGVSVQVIVNQHNARKTPGKTTSPSFIRLMKALGSRTSARGGKTPSQVSWAKVCTKSCRGRAGNVHQKMVLVSRAGGADGNAVDHITMMGSPNLTMLAARGQWNHNNVFIDTNAADGYPLYTAYSKIFREMSYDRPAPYKSQYQFYSTNQIGIQTFFFPKTGTSASTDPLLKQLSTVRCTNVGQAGWKGRTVVRIGMYAWFDEHGNWMAKRVRQLWDQGCDVAITTAILGNTVKSTLLSSRGRGRIPVRQVATYSKGGTILTYNHSKYIAVSGRVDNQRNQFRVWTGTTNWTNLGYGSDEATQLYTNGTGDYASLARTMYSRYNQNFQKIWNGPHSFSPSPASRISGDIGAEKTNQLGAGRYALVEEN